MITPYRAGVTSIARDPRVLDLQLRLMSPEPALDDVKDLENLFRSGLKFEIDEIREVDRSIAPENLKFLGMSAWDALWVVRDLAGWTMFLDPSGNVFLFRLGDGLL